MQYNRLLERIKIMLFADGMNIPAVDEWDNTAFSTQRKDHRPFVSRSWQSKLVKSGKRTYDRAVADEKRLKGRDEMAHELPPGKPSEYSAKVIEVTD